MRLKITYLLCFLLVFAMNAQQGYHVFPINDKNNPGSPEGNGSIIKPWDLQTAFDNANNVIKPGDTLWLHEGIYKGRYVSNLSGNKQAYVTVSAYKNDEVTLDGNITSKRTAVLEVRGDYAIYKDFEITWLGSFSRDQRDSNFTECAGLRHLYGVNCKFYDLDIHDNPGLGIGSWRHGEGSVIENCRIYNNGYIAKNGKGRGEGIYVQNKSDELRLIKNNVIFNNYYKGIEVWSAGKRAKEQYVKNIKLEGNIVFNSGSPVGRHYDNVIIASDDRNGINVAKNIEVRNNIFYHNTSDENGKLIGDAPSLTIGFNRNAPVEDIIIEDNLITGGYNGFRILYANSLKFTDNHIYTGMVQLTPEFVHTYQDWMFNSNTYYSKRSKFFRARTVGDYTIDEWQENYGLDNKSTSKTLSEFSPDAVVKSFQHSQQRNTFTFALFDRESSDVIIDLSDYELLPGQTYKVYDVENPKVVLSTGQLNSEKRVAISMYSKGFQLPLHNSKAKKTLSNFGVYSIEFERLVNATNTTEKSKGLFKRLFDWLGF